jgi:uncharacterized protein (TIGR03067 family)
MTRTALVMVMMGATAVVAAPVPKALKTKPPTLDAEWVLVSEERNGQVGQRSSRYNRWRINGSELELVADPSPQRDPLYRATLTSEPGDGDRPRKFEYIGENGYHRCGVCELDGDTLKIAFTKNPKTRPEKISSEGDGYMCLFKRVTADR